MNSAPLESIYFGGSIHTFAGRETGTVEAIGFSGGKVVLAGTLASVLAGADERTRRIDLAGRTMMPAFLDPHGHFPLSGICALFRVDLAAPPLGDVRTLSEVFDRMRERVRATPKGGLVYGISFDQSAVREGRFPRRDELDSISAEHPMVVLHLSGHACAANTLALALAGVDETTPPRAGGLIERDSATNRLTGLLEEPAAMGPLGDEMLQLGTEHFAEALAWSAAEYARQGVTLAQNSCLNPTLLTMLRQGLAASRLPISILALPHARMEGYRELEPEGLSDGMRLGARKLFSDGSIQIFTAYLSQPYHTAYRGDPQHRGYPFQSRESLARQIEAVHAAGRQIHIHVNGDAAGDDVIAGFARTLDAYPRADHRHTLIHGQTLRRDQLDRMAELNLTVSFFSQHIYVWGDRHRDIFLGPERASRISPARSALDRGLRITLHNDTPVTPMRPLALAGTAVERVTMSGRVLGPEERISPLEALRAHTIDAAWQVFLDGERGSLEPGKVADAIILSEDPLVGSSPLGAIAVQETLREGETIHRLA